MRGVPVNRALWLSAFCLALVLSAVGCGKGLEPREAALKARQEAQAAYEAKKPKVARKAADRAVAVRDKVEKDLTATPDSQELQDLAREVRAAAAEAVRYAELAEEEHTLADKTGSLKARGYRLARKAALKLAFAAMALAVEKAAADGYAALSESQRNAVDLAMEMTGNPKLADGSHDWKTVSTKVAAFGDAPPAEVNLVLALAYLTMSQDDLALVEAAMVNPDDVADPRERLGCRVLRGLVCHLNGMPRLAMREFEAAGEGGPASGPEFSAGICLLRALLYASDKDFRAADLEIMKATKIWPNNPVTVILTGEVMVGEGKYEKAAVTLEDLLRDKGVEPDPWLVGHVEKRAREIRDKKGEAEPLVHNSRFVREVALHYIWQAAKTSEPAQRLKSYIDSAKDFGAECLKHVPGLGEAKTGGA